MFHTRLVAMLATAIFMGTFTGTSVADHKSKANLPALKIISPANGATIENPVIVVFETQADVSKMTIDAVMKGGKMDTMKGGKMDTMKGGKMKGGPHLHIDLDKRVTMPTTKLLTKIAANRYQYSLGNAKLGRHTIRVYWADSTHMKAMSKVMTVSVTVK